jgi:hypothetical protein
MKFLNKILIFLIPLCCFNVISQWSIQVGYDYGLIQLEKTTSFTTEDKLDWNVLHRFSTNTEYILSSNFLFSLDLGIDSYSERIESVNTQSNTVERRLYNAQINTFRNQLSLGYLYEINENNSLVFKLSSGIFSIRDVKIYESSFEKTIFEDNTHKGSPIYYSKEHKDKTDFREVYGYKETYFSGYNILQTSLEYKYKVKDWSFNLFLGYTPFQKQIIQRFINNNLFLFGLRLGYTLPQKNKNNEK